MVVQKNKMIPSLCISRQKDCDLKNTLSHTQYIAHGETVGYTLCFAENGHVNIPLLWHPAAYVGMGCTSQRLTQFKGGGW